VFLDDLLVIVVEITTFDSVTEIVNISKEFPVEDSDSALFGVVVDSGKRKEVEIVDKVEDDGGG